MENIVFFDGVCSFCNQSVDFLIKIDKKNRLKFASLQGETAKSKLNQSTLDQIDSIVYYQESKIYTKSKAIIKLLIDIGGIWKVAYLGYIIPNFIRDYLYDLIARNRYKWFGKRETCRLPNEEEREKILS